MKRRTPATLQEIASTFDVDVRTITTWTGNGCPHRKRGGRLLFDLPAVIAWRREQDRREIRDAQLPDEARERTRKLKADASWAELRLKQRQGELIPAADLDRTVERVCQVVRSRVLGIRSQFAPRVLGLGTMAEAAAALDDISRHILAALHSAADELDEEDAAEVAE